MERFRSSSHRVFSVRSVFTFVLVVIITTLLWVTIGGQAAHAADPEANWTGESITFDNHTYNLTTTFKDTTNTIPDGATVYQSPPQTTAGSNAKKVFIIYFSSGVDPPTATTAKYVEFNISDDNETSNAQNAKDIKLTVKGEEGLLSSCSVEGIGWIICPVSQFAAKGMDTLFDDVLAPMIAVKPSVLGDPNNSMYVAWNVMRNIANVAFVIAFLIIIYSQLTSLGVSNYGLKKLIPRLIIAAILVNISFIISALAIDVSNILGYSVQNIFVGLRENLGGLTNDDVSGINAVSGQWVEVTGIILAGGGVVGGVAYAASGGLWLLIPLLLGLLSVLILVVVVLAARQAIIVILVIIAPLAFVANLLPNTEKWFDKWKDLFFTMLLFFPAFSLVFGGSQLAGQIIIKNAGDDIVVFLFGLAVQIAPLVITPLILKFSGSLLGRIAQITNNPSKGLLDRNKAWATNRAALTKERNLAGQGRKINPTTWGAGMVRNADFRKRRLQDRTNAYKQMGDNNYHASEGYEKVHEMAHSADITKQRVESRNSYRIQEKTNDRSSTFHIENAKLDAVKRALETSVKITEGDTKEYEAGRMPAGASPELQIAIRSMQSSRQATSIEDMRAQKATGQVQREFAEALKVSATLRTRAGGIQPLGADSVLASAVSAVRQADAQDIKNIQEASDLAPGDLTGTAQRMTQAIQAGDSIKARAYQNMLVTAGGAGMDQFRKTMIGLNNNVPVDVAELMRDNLLSNHGALKGRSNDLIDWAAKGGILETHTKNGASWRGLSDMDFISQHPRSQAYAFADGVNAFDKERAESILAADIVSGNHLTEDIKTKLRSIR